MTLNETQDDLIAEFDGREEAFEKYAHLIELGETLPPLPEACRNDTNALPGCQSKVWLVAESRGANLHFHADSDAKIIRGLLAVLLRVVNDRPPREIAGADLYCLDRIGLRAHLSPARADGLAGIVAAIQAHATAALK